MKAPAKFLLLSSIESFALSVFFFFLEDNIKNNPWLKKLDLLLINTLSKASSLHNGLNSSRSPPSLNSHTHQLGPHHLRQRETNILYLVPFICVFLRVHEWKRLVSVISCISPETKMWCWCQNEKPGSPWLANLGDWAMTPSNSLSI